jgi:hypothetical protein
VRRLIVTSQELATWRELREGTGAQVVVLGLYSISQALCEPLAMNEGKREKFRNQLA